MGFFRRYLLKLEVLLGKAAFGGGFFGRFWMGRRFSVRVQLQPGVLGKVWSEWAPTSHSWSNPRATIPPFFCGILWPLQWQGTVGVSWSSSSAHSSSEHSKKINPWLFCLLKFQQKPRLCPRGGRVTNPSCSLPAAPKFPFYFLCVLPLCCAEFTARGLIILSEVVFFFINNNFLFIFESTG